MNELVVYSNDEETLVCSIDDEYVLIKEYFTDGGRYTQDYDRLVSKGPVMVQSRNVTQRY